MAKRKASKKKPRKGGARGTGSSKPTKRTKKSARRTKTTTPVEILTASSPQKIPPKRVESEGMSTHKARTAWFNAREAWPMREPPVGLLSRARGRARANVPAARGNAAWTEAGPSNIGGRMTAIVVHPNDPVHILVGAAGGGVWSSIDGGVNWTPRWHDEPTLNIGSLCFDPANAQTVYCGTGEANLSADSYPGVGLYRSMDGGDTWHLLAPASTHELPRRIGRLAVDPFDSDHILVGGVSHRNGEARGLFSSADGGMSWAQVTTLVSAPYFCHDVVFSPDASGTIYVAIDAIGFQNGIWRTTDGGQTWTHLTSGLPSAPSIRRTSLAIAPSNPKILYAQMSDGLGRVLGVFRSANRGDTWTSIGGTHFANERQMTYNNTISVSPTDEDDVICGGVDLHRTKNGGTRWKKITDWRADRGVDPNYAHADQHMVRHVAGQPGLVYAMNDGGMDISLDGGDTWQNRSNGLATNMFYDLAAAATDGNMYGGGMQDNGTWLTLGGQPGTFVETTGGDGGFCAIDPNDPLHLYTFDTCGRVLFF